MSLKKRNISPDKDITSDPSTLKDTLDQLNNQIKSAYANLNYVTEPALIDSWIYEINAASIRYEFALNQLKKLNV